MGQTMSMTVRSMVTVMRTTVGVTMLSMVTLRPSMSAEGTLMLTKWSFVTLAATLSPCLGYTCMCFGSLKHRVDASSNNSP